MAKIQTLADDLVQPFQLESCSLRGRLVRLGPALDTILHQHAYPIPMGGILAEGMAIAAALATGLKYEGVFTLQAKGNGSVKLLVADVMDDGGIRAYAQMGEGGIPHGADQKKLLGKGYLAFTVDRKNKDDRYQGIVEMESGSLAEAVQHYFRQSEQLPTGIMAASRRDEQGHWRAGALMLQPMPREGGIAHVRDTSTDEDWLRAMMLMGTCTAAELTDPVLPANDLLYQLFNEEGVRVFEPHAFHHQCRCSEDRVTGMLSALPRDEVEALAVNGIVDVTCEFCNKSYKFSEVELAKLYI